MSWRRAIYLVLLEDRKSPSHYHHAADNHRRQNPRTHLPCSSLLLRRFSPLEDESGSTFFSCQTHPITTSSQSRVHANPHAKPASLHLYMEFNAWNRSLLSTPKLSVSLRFSIKARRSESMVASSVQAARTLVPKFSIFDSLTSVASATRSLWFSARSGLLGFAKILPW